MKYVYNYFKNWITLIQNLQNLTDIYAEKDGSGPGFGSGKITPIPSGLKMLDDTPPPAQTYGCQSANPTEGFGQLNSHMRSLGLPCLRGPPQGLDR
jgi:hypothetical protein